MSFTINRTEAGAAGAWARTESSRRAKGAGAVRLSEYDFSGVPDDELKACVHYEYARESEKLAKLVEDLRSQVREQLPAGNDSVGKTFKVSIKHKKFTKTHQPMYDAGLLIALGGCDRFPNRAWQDLTAEERQSLNQFPDQAVEMHNTQMLKRHPVFMAEVIQSDAGLSAVTLEGWRGKRIPAAYRKVPEEKQREWLLCGFMMVNLLYSTDEIVARFKEWLLARHPGAKNPPPEKRGRKSYRDRLSALGALRLRFYCRTLNDAQKVTAPLRDNDGLFYCDRTAWNRACARAVEYYREVLDLPETSLPIHFTKGWQK